jgi:hypothetical protein
MRSAIRPALAVARQAIVDEFHDRALCFRSFRFGLFGFPFGFRGAFTRCIPLRRYIGQCSKGISQSVQEERHHFLFRAPEDIRLAFPSRTISSELKTRVKRFLCSVMWAPENS